MLYTASQVQRFVSITDATPLNVLFKQGDTIISASSLIGVLSLPLCTPSTVMVDCPQADACAYFDKINEFIVAG